MGGCIGCSKLDLAKRSTPIKPPDAAGKHGGLFLRVRQVRLQALHVKHVLLQKGLIGRPHQLDVVRGFADDEPFVIRCYKVDVVKRVVVVDEDVIARDCSIVVHELQRRIELDYSISHPTSYIEVA